MNFCRSKKQEKPKPTGGKSAKPTDDNCQTFKMSQQTMGGQSCLYLTIEMQTAFNLFDKDGNGKISQDELTDVMRALGQNPTPQDVKMVIAEVDKDNDGEIDFEEFVAMMAKKKSDFEQGCIHEKEDILKAFKVFDKNNDGKIDLDEIKEVLTALGEPMSQEDFESLMREADIDGNGSIDFDEFSSVLANKFM